MFISIELLTILLLVSPMVMAQQPGTMTPEVHPPLPWHRCEKGGTCTQVHGEIVMDAAWRWVHNAQGQSCQNGDKWDATSCPDNVTCAKNCMLEGISGYDTTYGVSTNGNALRLNFVTKTATGKTVGSRLYLLADQSHYQMFKLLGQEFTFDVDVSTVQCGMNAALYLISMEADGGSGKHPTNKAGAKYGTGYCDSQCPRGARFIQGQANTDGTHGECCAEMDIWEANMEAGAFTSHPCDPAYHICTGESCGTKDRYATVCDPDGCGFNPYAQGDHSFYGPGKTVDTKKVFTVVTQFIESGGALSEIRRIYIQGGKVISHTNSMTQASCGQAKHGGLKKMGEALQAGMVLSAALWDDAGGHMAWLDSGNNGPCPAGAGDPAELETKFASSYVTYSNIRVGPINSTFHA